MGIQIEKGIREILFVRYVRGIRTSVLAGLSFNAWLPTWTTTRLRSSMNSLINRITLFNASERLMMNPHRA